GCDSGFGHLTALDLARDGFRVYAGCLTDNGIETLNTTAVQRGIDEKNLVAFRLDVTKDEDAKRCWSLVSKEEGGLYALVNNAGIADGGLLETSSMEVFERVFQVNTFGAVRKFALEAISDSLRREMKLNGHRVDVAVVEPFFAQTPILSFFDWSVEKQVRVFKEGIIPELREQVIEDFGGEEFVRWSIEQESTFRPPMMNPQKVVDVITGQVKAVATTDRSVVGSLMEKTVLWTVENISERWINLALDLGAQQKQKQWQLELSSRERTGCLASSTLQAAVPE
ncbi:hypothetical protein HDU93_007128, partial [Gonapodya sp. JEL0774]